MPANSTILLRWLFIAGLKSLVSCGVSFAKGEPSSVATFVLFAVLNHDPYHNGAEKEIGKDEE